MKDLDAGYSVEVDSLDKDSWHTAMCQFRDASYYQTRSYGEVHSGRKNISHLGLKKDSKIVGMAQASVYQIPLLPVGVAYVNWGPLWMPKGQAPDVAHLRNMVRALYNEYIVRRRYFLRIVPQARLSEDNAFISAVFQEEGFRRSDNPVETVMIDLSPALPEIRQMMDKKWRQTLQSGEKQNLTIMEGSDEDLCPKALGIYNEMRKRKHFYGGNQQDDIAVHRDLPDDMKLRLAVSLQNGTPVAVLGWTTFGMVGLPLISATGQEGLRLKASYVLWWKMIEYYKNRGFASIDTGGINRKRNPGGYLFKTHIVGKRFQGPDRYIGRFDACRSRLSMGLFWSLYKGREVLVSLRRRSA